ncbi:MAG: hypothetical protein HC843_00970 [Sphingomonadales bacterium]|nr:hypothetical protein [Sphingomonadales bacterium]
MRGVKIMMTRAFLFLLAIMSGLTTAQAAECVRPEQSTLGRDAVTAEIIVDALMEDGKAAVQTDFFNASLPAISAQRHCHFFAFVAPAASTTYIGDRNRQ